MVSRAYPTKTRRISIITASLAAGVLGAGTLAAVERDRIATTLDACGWNQSEAARRLGMSRNTLAARIRTHQLRR